MTQEEEKPSRRRDMTAGLLRQRRNLIATSIIVVFYYLGSVKITKFNIFGNHIEVGNPNVIAFGLWCFFGYFFYRYWLYFKEEPMDNYENEYVRELDKLCTPIFRKIALRQNNQGHQKQQLMEILEERSFSLIKSGNYTKLSFLKAENNAVRSGVRTQELHSDAHVSAIYYEFMFLPLHIIASTKMAFRDSRFSDYYLPYIFSIIAIMAWLLSLFIDAKV